MLDEILVSDFRSFRGDHRIPLAPLTIVVGENSAGKSTLLALCRLAWDICAGVESPNFNEDPFTLGSFDDMVAVQGAKGRRATSFKIGGRVSARGGRGSDALSGTTVSEFSRVEGQPGLKGIAWTQEGADGTLEASVDFSGKRDDAGLDPAIHLRRGERTETIDFAGYAFRTLSFDLATLAGEFNDGRRRLMFQLRGPRPHALSPIRTQPSRTYDPLQRRESSDGAHLPQLLAAMAQRGDADWEKLRDHLAAFGAGSGLFDELVVRRLGRKGDAEPFQIQLGLPNSKARPNLVDVGYGVSQVLPIVHELRDGGKEFLLVQQPEVHLHPRAQAELGSLLFRETKPRKRFIVETHSDYLINRVCADARDKKSTSATRYKDVLILYLERSAAGTRVYPIRLDPAGNLVGAPGGYRSFFLEEDMRLHGLPF